MCVVTTNKSIQLTMKVVVLFGVLAVVFLQAEGRAIGQQTDEIPKAMRDIILQSMNCGRELGPSKLGNLPNVAGLRHYPEDNDSLNALWGCIFKKKGIVDDDAHISVENLKNYLRDVAEMVGVDDEDAVTTMAEHCSQVSGHGPGQTAVKIQNCAMSYADSRRK